MYTKPLKAGTLTVLIDLSKSAKEGLVCCELPCPKNSVCYNRKVQYCLNTP